MASWHLTTVLGGSVEHEAILDILYSFAPVFRSTSFPCATCKFAPRYGCIITDKEFEVSVSCACGSRPLHHKEIHQLLSRYLHQHLIYEVIPVYLAILCKEPNICIAAWIPSHDGRLWKAGKLTPTRTPLSVFLALYDDIVKLCITSDLKVYIALIAEEKVIGRVHETAHDFRDCILVQSQLNESPHADKASNLAKLYLPTFEA
ncbi:hypothetical protein GMRT_12462 [Giardia muris]|uniref:Uncharacterized protein n=1 Tax=Giardia muris TaxID=5742 RepID=A0A4Z1SV53_GIAMU|nr:hypothetical protein GMRT_12462 [Giardia muris]|eukprot:TNJ27468.1 hypothetical protein GMRT_12462 [Giardia muris]